MGYSLCIDNDERLARALMDPEFWAYLDGHEEVQLYEDQGPDDLTVYEDYTYLSFQSDSEGDMVGILEFLHANGHYSFHEATRMANEIEYYE